VVSVTDLLAELGAGVMAMPVTWVSPNTVPQTLISDIRSRSKGAPAVRQLGPIKKILIWLTQPLYNKHSLPVSVSSVILYNSHKKFTSYINKISLPMLVFSSIQL